MADEATESGAWYNKPTFVASAVIVLLLVVLGTVLLLWPSGDAKEAPQAAPEVSAPPSGDSSGAASASVCGLEGNDETALHKAPSAKWDEAVGAIFVPTSKKAGPGVIEKATGVRSCFAHSPEGALFAATHLLAASGNEETMLATMRERGIDSPGKKVALDQAMSTSRTGGAPPMEVAGFRLLNYTGAEATVEVVFEVDAGSDTSLLTTGVDLEWTKGDWYAAYGEDGSAGPVSGQVSNLSGYTKWGAPRG